MSAVHAEHAVRTAKAVELVDVTDRLVESVRASGLADGIALAFVPHATCALILNEDEAGLRADVLRLVVEVIEPLRRTRPFAHDRIDDNAAAHLGAVMIGPSITVPVAGGRPRLGTWQSLFLVEMDGPRTRRLVVTVR